MANQLDKKFSNIVEGTIQLENKKAKAAKGQTEPKPWFNFGSDDIPSEQRPDKKEEKQLQDKTFNRNEANAAYVAARGKLGAKASDAAVPKLAGDFMGACVRDKRIQWRSRIRQMAHSFSADYGNGEQTGPLKRNTVDYLQRIFLKATEEKKSG